MPKGVRGWTRHGGKARSRAVVRDRNNGEGRIRGFLNNSKSVIVSYCFLKTFAPHECARELAQLFGGMESMATSTAA